MNQNPISAETGLKNLTVVLNILISHSWSYSDHYDRLSEWIFRTMWIVRGKAVQFRDTSVPKNDPIHDASNAAALEAAINERIIASDVVVIPTGMYASHSKWIGREIFGAGSFRSRSLRWIYGVLSARLRWSSKSQMRWWAGIKIQ